MTATDELRRMLDERGVEYETYIEQPTGFEHVKWSFGEHGSADFNLEFGEPWLTMHGTISGPEQAIAATLGAGTCKDVCSGVSEFTCSACGFECDLASWISLFDGDDGRHRHHHHGTPNYCPNCGRRCVG